MLCRLTAKNQAFNSMNQASATQHTGWSVKPDPLCHLKNYAGHQAFQQCVACLWLEILTTAVGAVHTVGCSRKGCLGKLHFRYHKSIGKYVNHNKLMIFP